MLQIDLSTLSAAELKRLLELAQSRNQQAFEERLRFELGRRGTRAPTRPTRMGFEPEAAAPATPALMPSLARRSRPAFAIVASAALIAVAVGWGMSLPTPKHAREPAVAQSAALKVMMARADAVSPLQAVAPPPSALETIETAEPEQIADAKAVAPAPVARPRPLREARAAAAAPPAVAKPNPCFALPTPGDRLVCGYPSLGKRDLRMQAAYEQALAAGADARVVSGAQAAWRKARDGTWDRNQLAVLYDDRIRELDAAAKAAAEQPVF